MKKNIGIVLLILLMLSSTLGCLDNNLHGTYISEQDENSFLKLNENNIYTLYEDGNVYVDHYDYDRDRVYLSMPLGGTGIMRNTSQILVDKDGERWIK